MSSFSWQVKQEIAAVPLPKECCILAEINALTQATGKLSIQAGKRVTLVFQANNLPLSRRINALLRFGFHLHPITRFRILPQFGGFAQALIRLDSNESRYLMLSLGMLSRTKSGQEVFRGLQQSILRRNCCARSFIRGAFLGCGTISNPQKETAAEFIIPNPSRAKFLQRVLMTFQIQSSIKTRKNKQIVYFKQADTLSDFLAVVEAYRAVLALEKIRTEREVSQRVNRSLNCDSANLNKQLRASSKQLAAINKISYFIGLSALPEQLEKLARLRLAYPELSIQELGGKSTPPLTKSAVQKQLNQLLSLSGFLHKPEPTQHKEQTS